MKVLANSLPKSGTNLLQRYVELLGFKYSKRSVASSSIVGSYEILKRILRRNIYFDSDVIIGLEVLVSVSEKWFKKYTNIDDNNYISGHLNYSNHIFDILNSNNIKIVHIIRDPRDVIISHIHYAKKEKSHLFHGFYKKLSFGEALEFTLQGGRVGKYYIYSFREALERTYGWLKISKRASNVLILKFEELIGELGGGNNKDYLRAIKKLSYFLGKTNLSENYLISLQQKVYGKSKTFRRGKIYGWKKELSERQIYIINSFIGDLIEKLGYE